MGPTPPTTTALQVDTGVHGPDLSSEKEADGRDQWASMAAMKRNDSIGAQLWQWANDPLSKSKDASKPASVAPSREGSMHGGNALFGLFKRSPPASRETSAHGGTNFRPASKEPKSREGSQHGGNVLFGLFSSPPPSREPSAHGGKNFGSAMKREGSMSNLWNWAAATPRDSVRASAEPSPAPSRESSSHGGGLFGGLKRVASIGNMWTWKPGQQPEEAPDRSTFESATSPETMRAPPPKQPTKRLLPWETNTDRGV